MARKVSVPSIGPGSLPARSEEPSPLLRLLPQIGFALALFAGCVAWATANAIFPADAVMPAVSTTLLLAAGAFGLIAWRARQMDASNVTYRDVAGALMLIGVCVAATIDAEQVMRLVQSQNTE